MNKLFHFGFIVLSILIGSSCAKVVAPDGGEKDIDPPVLLKSIPAVESLNYQGNTLELFFDEYLKLDKLESQLIITPPLTTKPKVKLGSKSIKLTWDEELLENRTYLFQFGDGIKDLNEGNIASNFTFVFSTGSILDTLKLHGAVLDSYSKKKLKSAKAILYQTEGFTDSTLFKDQPIYIAQVKDGEFAFNYLKEGSYELFVLGDENGDFKYQQNLESIAFLDSSLNLPCSLHISLESFLARPDYRRPTFSQQGANILSLAFNQKLQAKDLSLNFTPKPVSTRWNEAGDSLYVYGWFEANDSISLICGYQDQADTLNLKFRKMPSTNLKASWQVRPYYKLVQPFELQFGLPIKDLNLAKLSLRKDSLIYKTDSLILSEDGFKASLYINELNNGDYTLFFKEGALNALDSVRSDSFKLKMKLLSEGTLGSFVFKASKEASDLGLPFIYQLVNPQGKVIKESKLKAWEMKFIPTGTYSLRKILDLNGNGKWDTGDYLTRQQAEKVFYYEGEISIRANWTQEVVGF